MMISKNILLKLLNCQSIPSYSRLRRVYSILSTKARETPAVLEWSKRSFNLDHSELCISNSNSCANCLNSKKFHRGVLVLSAEKQHGQSTESANRSRNIEIAEECIKEMNSEAVESSNALTALSESGSNKDLVHHHRDQPMSIIQRLLLEKDNDSFDLEITKDSSELTDAGIVENEKDGAIVKASNELSDHVTSEQKSASHVQVDRQTDVIQKVEFPKLYHLAPLVNDSEILRNLVHLGVDLSKVEKVIGDTIVRMDFTRDVKPYLVFLRDIGVPADLFGHILTKNPYLFQHSVHNLKVRIDYLRSKKFKRSDIVQMIERQPTFLCMSTQRIDSKLGFYQKEFKLTGEQLRRAVSGLSKLITWNYNVFKDNKYHLKEFLGFTDVELKHMFLNYPKVFLAKKELVGNNFDFLHNVVGVSHGQIVEFPRILRSQREHIENRHRFLVLCGRAQYDPKHENYVSLQNLVSMKDNVWCVEVARSSVAEFNDFQRMI